MSPAKAVQENGSLPKGLWIGAAVFALLSAGVLAVLLRIGKTRSEMASNKRLGKAAVSVGEDVLRRAEREAAAERNGGQ